MHTHTMSSLAMHNWSVGLLLLLAAAALWPTTNTADMAGTRGDTSVHQHPAADSQ